MPPSLRSFFLGTLGFPLLLSVLVASAQRTYSPLLPSSHLNLGTLNWTLSNHNRSILLPTPFINQPHLALLHARLIDQPNVGLNEGLLRWVAEEPAWSWHSTFSLSDGPQQWSTLDRFYLTFGGLDTFCEITLAGQLVASTDNAFRSWTFDVSNIVHANLNTSISLSLRFASAYHQARNLALTPGNKWYPGKDIMHPQLAPVSLVFEYPYRNWARKQQSDFGWDWGPAYLPSGPLKPAFLVGLSSGSSLSSSGPSASPDLHALSQASSRQKPVGRPSSHLAATPNAAKQHVHSSPPTFWVHRTVIDIYRKGQQNNRNPDQSSPWVLNVTLPITAAAQLDTKNTFLSGVLAGTQVELPSQPVTILPNPDYVNAGPNLVLNAAFTVNPSEVGLWFPATLGEPRLYDLRLELAVSNRTLAWNERVGFRTIVVDQSRYSKQEVSRGITPGTRFTFVINGKPFYVQGSSMIPIDTFATRTNSSTIQWLLESALLAHQNVIRVWGGGAYQTDEFYDMCDEMGILAWSENVFACSGYPTSPSSFLDNMRAEVAENVARINRHPSNALWAGNNEGEGYLIAVNQTRSNGSFYLNEYDYLYNHVIRDVVLDNTRSISYLPSSTTQGYFSLDPYVSRYYNSTPGEIYGDQEHYDYNTATSFDISSYPVARFVNEFGFLSMPSIHTWDRILRTPEDYAFNSTVIRAHDKNLPAYSLQYPWPADEGQSQLTSGVSTWYLTPNITAGYRALLSQWAYSTQVFQAAYMASQIHYYRLGASRGENNMGAIYWQLNDIWEGISWSSIEYTGRWKLFHYLAERVQDHVIISPIYDQRKQTLVIYVTSDLWEPVSGTADWTWYDYAGNTLSRARAQFQVEALNSALVKRFAGLREMVPLGHSPSDAWLHLTLRSQDGKYSNEQFFHPIPLKSSGLSKSRVSVSPLGRNQVSVQVAEGGVAAWVSVEHPPGVRGYFKDTTSGKPSNAFFLRPSETRRLEFVVTGQDSDEASQGLEKKITVRSMWDNIATARPLA